MSFSIGQNIYYSLTEWNLEKVDDLSNYAKEWICKTKTAKNIISQATVMQYLLVGTTSKTSIHVEYIFKIL